MANWGASKKRALMRRRGTEGSRDDSASMVRRIVADRSTNDRPPRKSKEELRADAAAAFIAWREKAKAKQVTPCS
jgi:hypothetical protein